MPPSSRKMNTSFSTAFTRATSVLVITVMRGREMPLKKPRIAQSATPIGAPIIRGHQKATACCCTSASRPNGARIGAPRYANAAKNGTVIRAPHRATQVACPARQRRRLPTACATMVCTASPMPPNTITKNSTTQ